MYFLKLRQRLFPNTEELCKLFSMPIERLDNGNFTIRDAARLFNIQIDAGLLLKLQMVGDM